MGNIQAFQHVNPFEVGQTDGLSSFGSESFDFENDSPSPRLRTVTSLQSNKIICEYCQEYSFAQFHEEHVRICPCNPENLRANRDFQSRRAGNVTQSSSSSEIVKTLCEFCNELCYLKFQRDHQRICPKNPENIKINCRYCSKTFNLILYQAHLEACEENQRQRRRSVDPQPRSGRQTNLALSNLRRIKTNNEIPTGNQIKQKDDEQPECPICLEAIKTNFDMAVLSCNHKFHRHCLNNWSRRQKKCPNCRKEFL